MKKTKSRGTKSNSNKSEVYGFGLWMITFVVSAIFVLWAFIPDEVLLHIGVSYSPSKYWAIALPAYVTVMYIMIDLIYIAYNLMKTNPLDSMSTITDKFARPADHTAPVITSSMPETQDINISDVNRILYQVRRRDYDDPTR